MNLFFSDEEDSSYSHANELQHKRKGENGDEVSVQFSDIYQPSFEVKIKFQKIHSQQHSQNVNEEFSLEKHRGNRIRRETQSHQLQELSRLERSILKTNFDPSLKLTKIIENKQEKRYDLALQKQQLMDKKYQLSQQFILEAPPIIPRKKKEIIMPFKTIKNPDQEVVRQYYNSIRQEIKNKKYKVSKIVEMQRQNNNFSYLAETEEGLIWLERNEFMGLDLLKLAQFYETYIKFI